MRFAPAILIWFLPRCSVVIFYRQRERERQHDTIFFQFYSLLATYSWNNIRRSRNRMYPIFNSDWYASMDFWFCKSMLESSSASDLSRSSIMARSCANFPATSRYRDQPTRGVSQKYGSPRTNWTLLLTKVLRIRSRLFTHLVTKQFEHMDVLLYAHQNSNSFWGWSEQIDFSGGFDSVAWWSENIDTSSTEA